MELIDCGAFCVWWYSRPAGHSKSSDVRRQTAPMLTEWAFAIRCPPSMGGYFNTSKCTSGFASRDDAERAAKQCLA